MPPIYRGPRPKNVRKDAKYSVIHGREGMEVRLIYRLSTGEQALITTSAHPQLVEMVNSVKEQEGQPGGAFYINEHSQVIVPTVDEYYYAGRYERHLKFEFEGTVIGPDAPEHIRPGADWPGPKVGIPYTLSADGCDIKYKLETRPNVVMQKTLSGEVGAGAAKRLADRLSRHKAGGGRVYINEAHNFFAPIYSGGETTYRFLGRLEDDQWFRPPEIGGF